jgi:hypothetical protein
MIPGALVKNLCFTNFYSTANRINKHLPDDGIPFNSLMLIISPPDGTWIKVAFNGKIGWVNWNYLEEIWNESR